MIDRLRRLLTIAAPFLKGAAGAFLVLVLYVTGTWIWMRWEEFKIMRADIAFIHPQIEQARRSAQAPATAPTPPPAQ